MKRGIIKWIIPLLILPLFVGCSTDKVEKLDDSRRQLFDFGWKFKLDDIEDAYKVSFNDSEWRNLDLPHDWSIEGAPVQKNPSGNDGGYFPTGIGWYRKTFEVPASLADKNISVVFDGVYMNSEVFVNGKSMGVYPYGYSTFYYDITSEINFGGKNIIAVKVDNSIQKNSRWYSGSGIYRHVWIDVTDKTHIEQWGVAITTPKINKSEALVEVKTLVNNDSKTPKTIKLNTDILNNNSKVASHEVDAFVIEANSSKEIVQQINVENPKLWSIDSPNLYNAVVHLTEEGQVIDEVDTRFGIREISFTVEEGFKLNGKSIIMNGGCLHHDNGALGAKAYDRAEYRKAELMKEAGFNAVRTAHNPPSEAFLDACDELGLLVIDEVFDGWRVAKAPQSPMDYSLHFDEWWEKDVNAMVKRDINHPSIIMWSTGNEVIERTEPQAVSTAKMLSDAVKKIDTSRPITSAMTSWGQGWEIFDPLFAVHDVGSYNYQLHHAESDHKRVPDRILLQSESYPRDAFENWYLVDKNSYIVGDFVWTAMDYLGEAGIGGYYYPEEDVAEHFQNDRFPWYGAYCGDIDLAGWRKPISHYRSMLWNNNEKLYMAVQEPNPDSGEIRLTGWAVWPTWESWTWPGFEGKDIKVDIYSKYPAVRLYLNDELIGEKITGKEEKYKAVFDLKYTLGVIRAVGVVDGNEVESTEISTASEVSKIALEADRDLLKADGQDLSYVTVSLLDENGIVQPRQDMELTFNIKGNAEIVGVTNANLKDIEIESLSSRKTWNGKLLLIIKSEKKAGNAVLTVKGEDLADSQLTINIK